MPAWLNDPAMYHNRGNSTFAGESALYGDFKGMDDLWTERPEVVRGMERIYQKWVHDFDVDGFRVDTAKNVDMAFWTQWATALDRYAARHGRPNFFLFAEAFSADASITAPYVTQGRLDATLDFPFQAAARNFASRGGPAATSPASSRRTTGTARTRPTPTARSRSSAATTWGASAASSARTTRAPTTPNCCDGTAWPTS